MKSIFKIIKQIRNKYKLFLSFCQKIYLPGRVSINNIWSNWVGTWSGESFRNNVSTPRFKLSDIAFEVTLGYAARGTNLHFQSNGGNGQVFLHSATITVFLVKD